jgi:beta-alanine degradation protein BauB
MKKLILIVGMSILLLVVAKAQDPAKVDPAHYKVLLNNEYVRILEVRQKPGYKSPMHSHPHHAVYWLTSSTLKFTSPDGKTSTVQTKAGQVVWRNAETHTVEITGKTTSHALDIELKKQ